MKWIIILLGVLILLSMVNMFLGRNHGPSGMSQILMLGVGLVLGGVLIFLMGKRFSFSKTDTEISRSSTIVQSVENVFKVVSAEGQFSEIYDYQQTTHLFSFIPSTKKALIVVSGKVLMGYDFKKAQFETDESGHILKIIKFPEPEVLSVEPDVKYYNMENGYFNKFNNEDLTRLQSEAKKRLRESAAKSELPAIASKQMKMLLQEFVANKNWTLTGSDRIHIPEQKRLMTPD